MKLKFLKQAVLSLSLGSMLFLFSCNEDDPQLPDAPVAGFTATVEGATVTFTNTTSGTVDSYSWDFGDGTSSTEETPSPKTYTESGDYEIVLLATNEGGQDRATETVSVTVGPVPDVVLPLDFESSEITYTFTDFGGGVTTVIDNPDMTGSNTSMKVAQFVKNPGETFGGGYIVLTNPMDFSTNKTMKMKVWSPRSGVPVLLKVENSANDSQFFETTVSTSTANAWEELVFDFSNINTANPYDLVVWIFDNGTAGDGTDNFTFYFDDILLDNSGTGGGGGGTAAAPTDAPATPPARDAADVISIYGEAYGTAVGLNNVTWDGASDFVEESIAGNNVLKVTFENFLGSDLGSIVDASGMTHFHMDFWMSDDFVAGQVFNPKWSNHAGGAGETSSFLYTKAIGDTESQVWVSVDVPIADFTAGDPTQRAELAQFLLDPGGTIDLAYVDNIYFYNDGTGGGGGGGGTAAAPTDAPAAPPARDAADVISIYGEAYGTAVGLNNVTWDGASTFVEESIAGNNVLKVTFENFLGSDLGSVVDASGMTHFHMDFWMSDDFVAGQVFNPKWSNHAGGAGETSSFLYTKAIGNTESQVWVSVDVPIADFTAGDPTQRAELAQFLLDPGGTIDLAYVDNIYFYNDGTGGGGSGGGGGGTTAAPTDAPTAPPARNAADVISIYGEAYGTAVGLNNVTWDEGSEGAVETHANNEVMKLSFANFLGFDLGSEVDASAMTHVHIDFWIADAFQAGAVFLPKWSNHNGAAETDAFEHTFAMGANDSQTWLSIDLPVTDWTNVLGQGAAARANLKQLVIGVSGTLDVVYVDNIYFYK